MVVMAMDHLLTAEVHLVVGPLGCGKSFHARDLVRRMVPASMTPEEGYIVTRTESVDFSLHRLSKLVAARLSESRFVVLDGNCETVSQRRAVIDACRRAAGPSCTVVCWVIAPPPVVWREFLTGIDSGKYVSQMVSRSLPSTETSRTLSEGYRIVPVEPPSLQEDVDELVCVPLHYRAVDDIPVEVTLVDIADLSEDNSSEDLENLRKWQCSATCTDVAAPVSTALPPRIIVVSQLTSSAPLDATVTAQRLEKILLSSGLSGALFVWHGVSDDNREGDVLNRLKAMPISIHAVVGFICGLLHCKDSSVVVLSKAAALHNLECCQASIVSWDAFGRQTAMPSPALPPVAAEKARLSVCALFDSHTLRTVLSPVKYKRSAWISVVPITALSSGTSMIVSGVIRTVAPLHEPLGSSTDDPQQAHMPDSAPQYKLQGPPPALGASGLPQHLLQTKQRVKRFAGAKDSGVVNVSAPCRPKRPPTAFFIFANENRERVAQCMGTARGSVVAKRLGEEWNDMSQDQRQPFIDRAAQLKATYAEATSRSFTTAVKVDHQAPKLKKTRRDELLPRQPEPPSATLPPDALEDWRMNSKGEWVCMWDEDPLGRDVASDIHGKQRKPQLKSAPIPRLATLSAASQALAGDSTVTLRSHTSAVGPSRLRRSRTSVEEDDD